MVPRYPSRIVCLTEETTETLYLLGAGDRIVGMSGYAARPPRRARNPGFPHSSTRDTTESSRSTGPGPSFFRSAGGHCRRVIRRGCPVVTFNQRSVSEILTMIRMVGGLVGLQTDAERLAESLETGLHAIRQSAVRFAARPKVFFEEWDDPLISGIQWVEELVEVAGGEPIFPELRNAALARDRIVLPERVRRRHRTSCWRRGAERRCGARRSKGGRAGQKCPRSWPDISTRSSRPTFCSRSSIADRGCPSSA